MPIDLILVRHGESEGNLANRLSKKGDHSAFTDEFKSRQNAFWRLTSLGKEQAKIAGQWIRTNFNGGIFDRYYVSEYVRALETAAWLQLPDASWYPEFYLRERDWGQLDIMSQEERLEKFGDEMKRRERDGLYWAAPGGESQANTCLRIDRVLHTLHRECSDKTVLIVCHGEIIRSFQLRLERIRQEQFMEIWQSKNIFDKIHNCQIIHYTRRDPEKRTFSPFANWVRSICPWDMSRSSNDWRRITRKKYTNEELLAEVEKIPRLVS